MTERTLRDLARDFAKGALDRESYRRDRAALIDGIVAGAIKVPPIDYAAPVVAKASLDSTRPGKRRRKEEMAVDEELDFFDITQVVPPAGSEVTQVVSGSADITPPRPARPARQDEDAATTGLDLSRFNQPLVLAIGAAAALALVIAVAMLAWPRGQAAPSPANPAPAAEATDAAPTAGAQGTDANAGGVANDAIVEFLRMKNWSDDSLAQFSTAWQALPQVERDAAANSGEMLQLANAIYRKLLELRALSQLDQDAASAEKETRLLEFARTIGINDARLAPAPAPG